MFYISKVPIMHPFGHFIKTVEYWNGHSIPSPRASSKIKRCG